MKNAIWENQAHGPLADRQELPEYENCKLARISGQGKNHEFSIHPHVYVISITNVVDLHPIFLPES